MQSANQRAQPPHVPEPSRALQRAQQKHREYVAEREKLQLRSFVRGLIVLAVIVLLASILRAGYARAFPLNWWRP